MPIQSFDHSAACVAPHVTQAFGQPEIDLAGKVVRDLARAWREGERLSVEHYLRTYPELRDDSAALLRLIYEEFTQRRQHGDALAAEAFIARFPEFSSELAMLLAAPPSDFAVSAPGIPEVGQELGDFLLVAQLGKGAVGSVFLARQPALGDRPLVLKVTPADGHEHLSLARLQHSNIVPLYWVHDEPIRHLRAIVMPYFGGTTLEALLTSMEATPPQRRTGRQLVEALDAAQKASPVPMPSAGPMRAALGHQSYVQAICSLVACLADGLQYAHERDLIHLDIKPANILVACDGQPMLLDFHLARPPIHPDGPPLEWLGGTLMYQSPEHDSAMQSLQTDAPLTATVDARADLYSLGIVLYEALAGELPPFGDPGAALRRLNPAVSQGLASIVARCLREKAVERYETAGTLADDLRRHVFDRPLQGVAPTGMGERFRKWRRREPLGLPVALLKIAVVLMALLFVGAGAAYFAHASYTADVASIESRDLLARGDHEAAERAAQRGLQALRWLPGQSNATAALEAHVESAQRGRAASELHALTDRLRLLIDVDALSPDQRHFLHDACARIWETREWLLLGDEANSDDEARRRLRGDLLDLALLWSEVRGRATGAETHREVLAVLEDVERRFGTSPILETVRAASLTEMGLPLAAAQARARASLCQPRTAWEHAALGRWHMRLGDLQAAMIVLDRAVALEPGGFWPNYYQGVCAYRLGRARDALAAFRVCIALAPERAECYYNRGLCYRALKQSDAARRDYDRALELQPTLGLASLNRGVLAYEAGNNERAAVDLRHALEGGAPAALVHFNLALVHLGNGDKAMARQSVEAAIEARSDYPEARQLLERLRR